MAKLKQIFNILFKVLNYINIYKMLINKYLNYKY